MSGSHLAIFAYGSLLFRPGFAYLGRTVVEAPEFERSFRQASPDHRGTPERPGRVVTLVPTPGSSCVGAVYWVAQPAGTLLERLDERERAGYERVSIEVFADAQRIDAVTWIAPTGNAFDVGDLELPALAHHIRHSRGPSGRNDDYVFQLERALHELGARDALVSELAALLRT